MEIDTKTTVKPHELRLGNWVKSPYTGKPLRINVASQIEAASGGVYEPLPLTPGLLEKAGFTKKWEQYGYSFTKDGFRVYKGSNWEYYQWSVVGRNEDGINEPDVDLPYLHQLQNLFYAITGTELTIQL